ncbi:hypothetical protein HK099_004071 [Clydaea vesicula]|uniref:Uncharacterized protein n=1 Tax=Clydaea vesicula TaxID=447962 RepID=A0AAD5UAR6_9FUNG|nr:hypothetical protein HK099_004071 [Clydaea vesicula]
MQPQIVHLLKYRKFHTIENLKPRGILTKKAFSYQNFSQFSTVIDEEVKKRRRKPFYKRPWIYIAILLCSLPLAYKGLLLYVAWTSFPPSVRVLLRNALASQNNSELEKAEAFLLEAIEESKRVGLSETSDAMNVLIKNWLTLLKFCGKEMASFENLKVEVERGETDKVLRKFGLIHQVITVASKISDVFLRAGNVKAGQLFLEWTTKSLLGWTSDPVELLREVEKTIQDQSRDIETLIDEISLDTSFYSKVPPYLENKEIEGLTSDNFNVLTPGLRMNFLQLSYNFIAKWASPLALGATLEMLAHTFTLQGNYKVGAALYIRALQLVDASKPKSGLTKNSFVATELSVPEVLCRKSILSNNISNCFVELNNFKEAEKWSVKSVEEARLSGENCEICAVIAEFGLAKIYEFMNEKKIALKHFGKARELAIKIGYQQGVDLVKDAILRMKEEEKQSDATVDIGIAKVD